jgi:DNA modification methylase
MKHYNTIEESHLYFGNNLEVMDDLPAYSIDLIVTDPPYNFTKANCTKMYKETSKKLMSKSGLYDYDDETEECRIKAGFSKDDIYRWLDMTPRLVKKMNAYIFCSEVQVPIYAMWAEEHGYKFSILIWEKPLAIISKSRYSQNVEFIVRIYDDGTALNKIDDCEQYNRVLHIPVVTKKLTPTQKPVALMARLIRLSSQEGGVVLDPFLGSGTTAVAAQRLGRKYIGIERNERFYRIAENRLKEECVQQSLF